MMERKQYNGSHKELAYKSKTIIAVIQIVASFLGAVTIGLISNLLASSISQNEFWVIATIAVMGLFLASLLLGVALRFKAAFQELVKEIKLRRKSE